MGSTRLRRWRLTVWSRFTRRRSAGIPARRDGAVSVPNSNFPAFQQRLLEDRRLLRGRPIALVVADTRYNAEDAATLVVVDYDILPGAADCKSALEDGAPMCHSTSQNNEGAVHRRIRRRGKGFCQGSSEHREEYWIHQGGGFAIENRAVVAEYDEIDDMLTIWSATQSHSGEAERRRYVGLGIR